MSIIVRLKGLLKQHLVSRNLNFFQKTNITKRQLTVLGYCNQDEVKEMFYAADLVAMPSRIEGFGLIDLLK